MDKKLYFFNFNTHQLPLLENGVRGLTQKRRDKVISHLINMGRFRGFDSLLTKEEALELLNKMNDYKLIGLYQSLKFKTNEKTKQPHFGFCLGIV